MEHTGESLAWVVVDDAPRHVSDFATLAPRERPRAACPQCARRVTLKLGRVRRHHAAHPPSSACPAIRAETALHLNAKVGLAMALRRYAGSGAALEVRSACAGASGEQCDRAIASVWLDDWDAVDVELRVGSRRPDIVLQRDGKVVGAIEVRAWHAVPAEKARALRDLGVAWIEVAASEALATPDAWRPPEPLAVLRGPEGEWRCDAHAAQYEAAWMRARESSVLRAARVVDVYHEGGVRERLIYRVSILLLDGAAVGMRLQRGTLELLTVPLGDAGTSARDARRRIHAVFVEDVERHRRGDRDFFDSPMRWATDDAAENIVDEALADRVGRDPTPLATTFPRRWFHSTASHAWFLPADMRDVRWDRPPLDVFAAHPAWQRRASAVAERPAPEGSWATPIFAGRPIAAMFGAHRPLRRVGEALAVVEIDGSPARRAIVIVERACDETAIAALSRELRDSGVDAVWLSSPRDWSPAFRDLVWAAAGRDQRGFGAVLVDGLGVFRAERFATALQRGDRRLSSASIRRKMAARIERLAGIHI